MKHRLLAPAGFALAALTMTFGCNNSSSHAKLVSQLAELKSGQETMIARLGELEQTLKERPVAPAAAKPKAERGSQPDPKATYKVVLGDAVVKGPADAKITLIAWSDFQCPYCSKVTKTLEELEELYGQDIRIAFKHNPLSFHPNAMPAALAAEAAARQGKFWEMHDKLFANQRALTPDNFQKFASELGLDAARFEADMKDPKLKKKISEQQSQGASLGARGTPAFFINGRFLSGARPLAQFKALIDEELKKADELLAQGVSKATLYDTVIKTGKTKV